MKDPKDRLPFTPGPWTIHEDAVVHLNGAEISGMSREDLNLILSAPDMYLALANMERHLRRHGGISALTAHILYQLAVETLAKIRKPTP